MDQNKLVVEHGSLTSELGEPFKIFSKFVRVFDLYFVATPRVPDDKLLHGAKILHQYIDNDGDSVPDNSLVYSQLVRHKATMVMFLNFREMDANDSSLRKIDKLGYMIQDLEACETNIPGEFDASLEECLHLVQMGYAKAYPREFGDKRGSTIADCCDAARGGYFRRTPRRYPREAWFTYDDRTCDYEGQIIEYMYWALTSILGAQRDRTDIQHEWKLNTIDLVQSRDPLVYSLLTDPAYRLPTRLPCTDIPPSDLNPDGGLPYSQCSCL